MLVNFVKRFADRLNRSRQQRLVLFVVACLLSPAIGPVLLVLMLGGFASFDDLGMRRPRSWAAELGLGLALGLALFLVRFLLLHPASVWAASLVDGATLHTPSELVAAKPWAFARQIVLAIVHAGFFEEFVYRGYLLNEAKARLGDGRLAWPLAILGVGTLFGALHFYWGLPGVIFATTWFVLTSGVYLAIGRNLWPMMVSHALADILTFTLAYLGWLPDLSRAVFRLWGSG